MAKLTAEDFERHLAQVVEPGILGQVSLDNRKIACDEMAAALNPKPHTERSGHSR